MQRRGWFGKYRTFLEEHVNFADNNLKLDFVAAFNHHWLLSCMSGPFADWPEERQELAVLIGLEALHAPPRHLCHSRSVGEECGWAAPKAARVVPPHAPPPDPCHFRSMGEECGTLRRADHLIVGSVAVCIEML